MSKADLQSVKKALVDAGLEIYRAQGQEVQVAERVRLHLMDSGVRVQLEPLAVSFTCRSQRSDFPNVAPTDLFEKVRAKVGTDATARGFVEAKASTTEVKDPVDGAKVLDVWHEVTYAKETDVATLVDEVRWALAVDKYVA